MVDEPITLEPGGTNPPNDLQQQQMRYGMGAAELPTKTTIDSGDSPYAITGRVTELYVDATGGNVAISLPAPLDSVEQRVMIRRIDLSGFAVTVTATGGADIDAGASMDVLPMRALTLHNDGTGLHWWSSLDSSALAALVGILAGTGAGVVAKTIVTKAAGVVNNDSDDAIPTSAAILDYVTAADKAKLGHISVTQAVDLDAIETRVNSLDAAIVLRGAWDASAGTFPGGGTAQAGDSYIVSVAGAVNAVTFAVGDRIIAILDNASTTVFAANWFKADYTDQVSSVAGRTGAVVLSASDVSGLGSVVEFNYTQSDTAPPTPASGDKWLDTTTGIEYTRYDGAWITTDSPTPVPDDIPIANVTGLQILSLLTAAERKNPASYTGEAAAVAGATRVIQADMPGILWSLIAADVTLDASWIGVPYTVDPDGDVIVSMELASVAGTVPDLNVLGVSGGVPSIGDGITTGGRKVLMNSKPAGYVTMTSIKTTPVSMVVSQSGATGFCYSINGGTPVYFAGVSSSLSNIVDPKGSPTNIAVWPATSATSGRVGDLTFLTCGVQALTSLDVSGLTALTHLNCSENALTSLDVSGLTALTFLSCYSNNLTCLDVSGLTALTFLACYSNNLTSLDVSGLTALYVLYCYGNALTTLDVSGLTALYSLECHNNNLGAVTFAGNTDFFSVYAYLNTGPMIFTGDLPYSNYGGYVGYCIVDINNSAWVTTDALYAALVGLTVPDPGLDAGFLNLTGCPCLGGGATIINGTTYTAAQVEALITAKKLYY